MCASLACGSAAAEENGKKSERGRGRRGEAARPAGRGEARRGRSIGLSVRRSVGERRPLRRLPPQAAWAAAQRSGGKGRRAAPGARRPSPRQRLQHRQPGQLPAGGPAAPRHKVSPAPSPSRSGNRAHAQPPRKPRRAPPAPLRHAAAAGGRHRFPDGETARPADLRLASCPGTVREGGGWGENREGGLFLFFSSTFFFFFF